MSYSPSHDDNSNASALAAATSLVACYGKAQVGMGDDFVFFYAQTDSIPDEKTGYYPSWSEGFDLAKVNEVLTLAKKEGVNLVYERDYTDRYTDTTFSVFIWCSY